MLECGTPLLIVILCGRSNASPGTTVGGDFHLTRQMARFSSSNLFRISPRSETVNYRPYSSPSFEVAKPGKITAFQPLSLLILIIILLLLLHQKWLW